MVIPLSLKKIIKVLQKELNKKDNIREQILSNSRTITRISKQAILMTHQGRDKEAEKKLRHAKKELAKIKKISSPYPYLASMGALRAAYEEYVEAWAFLKFVKGEEFLNPKEFEIPTIPYLLGLADLIGELRRKALDSLRIGDLETSEKCLETMEEVYLELMALENVHGLAPNIRRKVDVSRKIIEATRGDITSESRRSLLATSLKNLKKQLNSKL